MLSMASAYGFRDQKDRFSLVSREPLSVAALVKVASLACDRCPEKTQIEGKKTQLHCRHQCSPDVLREPGGYFLPSPEREIIFGWATISPDETRSHQFPSPSRVADSHEKSRWGDMPRSGVIV